jgi:hypothetical protein
MSGRWNRYGSAVLGPGVLHKSRSVARLCAGTTVLALSVFAVTGCFAGGNRSNDAMQFGGPGTSSVLAPNHVSPGEVLGFAFPAMRNTSDQTITITGFKLTNVPEGATVERYRVLASTDTDGYLLGSFPVQQRNRDGYDTYPGYPPPVIQPHRRSRFYGVVYLKVVGPLDQHANGCQVSYTVNEEPHTQTAPCDFQLDQPPR